MNKTKALVSIIIFLLITNIAMLIFFIASNKQVKKSNHESSGMYNALQTEVGFTKDQLTKYQELRKEQIQKVKPLFNEVRTAKKDFYALIYLPDITDSLVNADADSIAQKQKTLDLQMFSYFKTVRNLCTPGQTEKFDTTLKKEVARMISRPPKEKQNK